MKSKNLVIIIFIAVFFRLWQLGNVPPSPSLDEVSIGWNAYSILKTGMDEYGNKFPLLLRAYDDWRPALYVYTVLPFVKLFGLNVVNVRLPSVFLSIAVVYLTYLIAGLIFDNNKSKYRVSFINFSIGEVSAFLVAISPWHIYLSRLGHEANLGLFFGIYMFLKSIYTAGKSHFLIWSAVCFLLSMYSYQSQKISTPIIIFGLIIIYFKELLLSKKVVLLSIIVGVLLFIPLARISFSDEGLMRFKGTSVLNQDFRNQQAVNNYMVAVNSGDIFGKILNSPKIITTKVVASNYLSHFNPRWLFYGTQKEDHKVPYMGLLHNWEMFLIVFGLYYLFKLKLDKKLIYLIGLLLLTSPLPAAITTGAPHAMRSYMFIPVLQIIGGLGFIYLYICAKKNSVDKLMVFIASVLVLFSTLSLWKNYFIKFPMIHSKSFQYALSQSFEYVENNDDKYKKIIFSNQDDLYQSYMFFLYNTKYDPFVYLEDGGTKSGGYNETHMFDKYEFRPIEWEKDKGIPNQLIIANSDEIPENVPIFKQFNYLDETIGVIMVKSL
ncbi:hypothetical protein ACFL1A_00075 [Patescibacteria group bacterium]